MPNNTSKVNPLPTTCLTSEGVMEDHVNCLRWRKEDLLTYCFPHIPYPATNTSSDVVTDHSGSECRS